MIELAQDFDLHPNQIKQWQDQLLEGATGVFGKAPEAGLVMSRIRAAPSENGSAKVVHGSGVIISLRAA